MKKRLLTILLFLLVILNIIFLVFEKSSDQILIIGGNTIIEYTNNNVSKIKNITKINKKYDYEKFYVYNNNSFEENYVSFNENSNFDHVGYDIYNKNMEKINLNNIFLAYKGNLKIKVLPTTVITEINDSDKKILDNELYRYQINSSNINFNKVREDLNQDGKLEEIYIVNNFNSNDENKKKFSIVFLRTSNDQIIKIADSETSYDESYKLQAYNFAYAIDIDNDNQYEIALSSYYDESAKYYKFYKYDEGSNTIKEIN